MTLPLDNFPTAFADDLAALQGSWEQVGLEVDGIADPPDHHSAPGALAMIHGNHFEVRTIEGELLLKGNLTLDASTTPKAITWVDSIGADTGNSLPATCRLKGGRFVFVTADAGMPRPNAFRTSMGLTRHRFIRKR